MQTASKVNALSSKGFTKAFNWESLLNGDLNIVGLTTVCVKVDSNTLVKVLVYYMNPTVSGMMSVNQTLLTFKAVRVNGVAKLVFLGEDNKSGVVYYKAMTPEEIDELVRDLAYSSWTKTRRSYSLCHQCNPLRVEYYTSSADNIMNYLHARITEWSKSGLRDFLKSCDTLRIEPLTNVVIDPVLSNVGADLETPQLLMSKITSLLDIVSTYAQIRLAALVRTGVPEHDYAKLKYGMEHIRSDVQSDDESSGDSDDELCPDLSDDEDYDIPSDQE
ncbi:hypothetical protein [Carp edema virus]|nr:hypothetical protein [Carp edema virus]